MAGADDLERNIALMGLGYWGKNILRNLVEMGVLHTACDLSAAALDEYKGKYPDERFTQDPEELFKDPAIKAVAFATPAVTHYDMVKRTLLSGRDAYVEKPLALTLEEGRELVEIARREGRVLMVGHILQYHPAVIRLKEMIAGGELGEVEYIYSNRLNIGKLRTEENILWSFAPHDISVILALLGKEPTKVTCHGGAYLNKGIYDTTMTTLEFPGKVRGHIFVSWLHPFKEQKLVVVGSKKMAVFDDVSQEKLCLYPHSINWTEGRIPVAEKAERQVVELPKAEPLRAELMHFTKCVRHRSTPLTDGSEGLMVLSVLHAAEESLKEVARDA
ncbi:MAG: Gfo/Idh/MocA family oxidoreductase [Thermodesulfovibrionales bacterium]|nr:Gfo/Idh/MocA family oxidoreductase [Thermodesulfovibrionales bacterium]